MKSFGLKLTLSFLVLALSPLSRSDAQEASPSAVGKATGEVAAAAQKFLATLDETQRTKVIFDFKDGEQRKRWSNFPEGIFKRAGLRMGDLNPPQREAAMAVLSVALSPQGYEKVLQIVEADEVLKQTDRGGRGRLIFGRDLYYLSFLGQPSATEPWMIQFGGHHLGLNITLAGEQGTLAPSHTAAQPAIYQLEGKTVRPLERVLNFWSPIS